MATETRPTKKKPPRGRVQFERLNDGKTLAVHLDRQGFRRLLAMLERLAETGERQSFEKSGRGRSAAGNGSAHKGGTIDKLMFDIDDER